MYGIPLSEEHRSSHIWSKNTTFDILCQIVKPIGMKCKVVGYLPASDKENRGGT